MMRNAVGWRGRAALAALGALAMVALAVPSADARVRVRVRSAPRPHSAPSVSRPHVPSHATDAPKAHLNTPSGRSVTASLPSAAPGGRGIFGRFWDWLLGRKPAPAPAQVAQAAPTPAPAGAQPMPNIVVPIPSARPSGLPVPPGAQAAAQPLETDPQRAGAPVGALARATAATVGGASLAAALQQSFGKGGAEARQPGGAAQATIGQNGEKPAPKPSGYILHLTNGRSIPVSNYEEKGDQVLITQRQGSYGLPRSLIARIETREAEPEVAPTGRGGR